MEGGYIKPSKIQTFFFKLDDRLFVRTSFVRLGDRLFVWTSLGDRLFVWTIVCSFGRSFVRLDDRSFIRLDETLS